MRLREARAEDVDDVSALLEAAFRRPDEARLFRTLAESDELALALLAVGPPPRGPDRGVTMGAEGGGTAGSVPPPSWGRDGVGAAAPDAGRHADSPAPDEPDRPVLGVAVLSHLLSPKGSVGLGPLAVRPECSDRGIGKALIGDCVERARRDGHKAIFVLGQPPYYTRFGFSTEAARPFRSDYPAEFLMALELEEGALEGGGELRYPPAFAGL